LAAKIQDALSRPVATLPAQSAEPLPPSPSPTAFPTPGWRPSEIVACGEPNPLPSARTSTPCSRCCTLSATTPKSSRIRPEYFTNLPLDYIAGFYPCVFGPQNDLRIPVFTNITEPDPIAATAPEPPDSPWSPWTPTPITIRTRHADE
jgi:hypothetical protein